MESGCVGSILGSFAAFWGVSGSGLGLWWPGGSVPGHGGGLQARVRPSWRPGVVSAALWESSVVVLNVQVWVWLHEMGPVLVRGVVRW